MLSFRKNILMKAVEELIEKSVHTKVIVAKNKVNLHSVIYDMSVKWKMCKKNSEKDV